jgi:hypothetical protein
MHTHNSRGHNARGQLRRDGVSATELGSGLAYAPRRLRCQSTNQRKVGGCLEIHHVPRHSRQAARTHRGPRIEVTHRTHQRSWC